MNRVAIIGAGHVGSTAAYALMLRALFREIVLVDNDQALAAAEAADISDANAQARPARIWAGDYGDAAAAQIAVITAGAATQGTESRLSVAGKSADIVRECTTDLMAAGFAGVLIVASNPVDLMALTAFRHSGLPATRVIGTGTLLDSGRLRQALAAKLHVAPAALHAMILGEHGDSQVAAFSAAHIGGVPLEQFAPGLAADLGKIADEVKRAAYRIIAGKGHTSFGIATAIVRICEAVLRDEHSVLPVSVMLDGEFGLSDVYLSLPCVIGAAGVERILLPDLSPTERDNLMASAAALTEARRTLG